MSKNRFSKKDIAIIVLSALLLVMLVVIITLSKKRDQMISESLRQDTNISTDDVVAKIEDNITEYFEITEVNAEKWIEIHNTDSEALDISGIKILVSGKLAATVKENTIIGGNEFLAIDIETNPGANDQNIITIIDTNDTLIKALLIPRLSSGKSFGLVDAEKNIWGLVDSTKSSANSSENIDYLECGGIGLSAPGGFYNNEFDLELTCANDEKIYYTTDCTTPTTKSTLYEEAIHIKNNSGSKDKYAQKAVYNRLISEYMPGSIDTGCIVRAIKVDSTGTITGEMCQAYYVGLKKDSDYLNYPVISITTDPENLFDYENGIYIAGKSREDAIISGSNDELSANYYKGWKKPITVEYYEVTKDKTFEGKGQINVEINTYSSSRQKDFLISLENASDSEYSGSSILDFIDSEGLISLTQNYQDNNYKLRTILGKELTDETEIGVQVCQPCSLFLDGEYWGLYVIRQNFDKKYFQEKYGVTEEITTHSEEEYNELFVDFYTYVIQNDISLPENYRRVQEMMDVDNFIDYVCFNVFIGNSSFSPERGTAWRTISDQGDGMADGRWRFLSGDLSDTMYLTALQTPTINTFLQPGIQGDRLLQSLLMNDEFCEKLEIRMKELASGCLRSENCKAKIDNIANLIKKPAVASFKRFFGSLSESSFSNEVDRINEFFDERPEYIIRYTEELAKNGGDIEKAWQLFNGTYDDTNSNEIEENSEEFIEENTEENTEEDTEEVTEDNTNG